LNSSFAVAVGDDGWIGMWNGSTWTLTKNGIKNLYTVSGSSTTNIWAGGQGGNGWRWQAGAWVADNLPATRDVLGSWRPSTEEGYAIANGESYRWNGIAWAVLDIPAMRQGKGNNRVITGAGNDAFIVGSRLYRGWR